MEYGEWIAFLSIMVIYDHMYSPNLIKILNEYGCGCDCSSMTELMLSEAIGVTGEEIMFSSNDTPLEEFAYANKLGAIINLDDITHIEALEETLGFIPETISCRYNPGGYFSIAAMISWIIQGILSMA